MNDERSGHYRRPRWRAGRKETSPPWRGLQKGANRSSPGRLQIGGSTMIRRKFIFTALAAALAVPGLTGTALAQKEKEQKGPKEHGAKEQEAKGQQGKEGKKHHNHHDGKQLVGEKIKHEGRHEIERKGQ